MQINKINSNNDKNLSFKNMYLQNGMNDIQKSIAHNVSLKLSKVRNNNTSYLQEIKNLGYDVLAINTELNDPGMIRLCIIRNMESNKQPDGEYVFLDAIPIAETGMHFSPEGFFDVVKLKTAPKFPKIKAFFSKLFDM